MHTEQNNNLLLEYLQGTLDDTQRREIELHLRQCVECRQEAEELRATLQQLRQQQFHAPSPAYFASLVPRIRMRLEQRAAFGWPARLHSGVLRNPVFTRIALPLATAGLAVALLVQMPLEQKTTDPIDIAATLDMDDVVEVLASEQTMPLSELTEPTVVSTIPEEVVNRQIAAQLVAGGAELSLSEWLETPTDQLLKGLSEEELASLIQRLAERMVIL